MELKRTDDDGHMELQAIRCAAMVSSVTLEGAASVYARTLGGESAEGRVQRALLEFLDIGGLDEVAGPLEVRIVPVAADFSTELSTAVMWLNDKGWKLFAFGSSRIGWAEKCFSTSRRSFRCRKLWTTYCESGSTGAAQGQQ